MQAAQYVGYNVPLTVRKFLNDVAPGTCFNRQLKQNNSPLSVDGWTDTNMPNFFPLKRLLQNGPCYSKQNMMESLCIIFLLNF